MRSIRPTMRGSRPPQPQPTVVQDQEMDKLITPEMQDKVDNLTQQLGLTESTHQLDYGTAAIVSQVLQQIAAEFQEAVYWHFTFQAAEDIVLALAPKLSGVETETAQKICFLHSSAKETDTVEGAKWQLEPSSSTYLMLVQKDRGEFGIDHRQAQRVLIVVHEYLHAIMDEMFRKDWIPRDYSVQKKPMADLQRTIFEGVSLAAEHEVLNNMRKEIQDPRDLESLNNFANSRLVNLKETNRLLHPKFRAERERQLIDTLSFSQEFAQDLHLETDPGFAYSEGARLAIALRRNGWQMSDLPLLIEKIIEIIEVVTGHHEIQVPSDILLSREKNSQYNQIIEKIRALKN